jgi:hypothetical protein
MSTEELTSRCPQCAHEMDSPDAVVCLNCGYNLETRAVMSIKKTVETTGADYFVWWLPGILCIVAILALIGFDAFYIFGMDPADDDEWWRAAITYGGVKVWIVIMTLFAMYYAGKFAVKRLVYENEPPEKEMRSSGR